MSDDIIEKGQHLLSEAFLWKTRAAKANDKFNSLKRKLASFFKENPDIGELTLEGNSSSEGSVITAKISERVSSLTYDVDALRQSLSKEQFNEVVQKSYYITDIDKMVSLLKDAGVKPADFKALIQVEETPIKSAIQQLFSVGDITAQQLKGTYSATISQTVLISCKEKRKGDQD